MAELTIPEEKYFSDCLDLCAQVLRYVELNVMALSFDVCQYRSITASPDFHINYRPQYIILCHQYHLVMYRKSLKQKGML